MPHATPQHDLTDLLDTFRAAQLSHLLVAAATEFDVGRELSAGPLPFDQLRQALRLAERPAVVLLTALRSLRLIDVDAAGRIALTGRGREQLSPESPFHVRGYLGLGAFSRDAQAMIACLRDDRPAGGVSFVYHAGGEHSALDDSETAGVLTRAMADRARNVAPALAAELDLSGAELLLDVGGGHGLYSYALLQANPRLRAVIVDRRPALDVARGYAAERGLTDRVELVQGDVHAVEPTTLSGTGTADVVLIANLLHDYDADHAEALVRRYANALPAGGRLLVLDSFLHPVPPGAPPVSDGPREVAAYSALLFSICEGRCYRLDEVQGWMRSAGLRVDEQTLLLPAHGGVLTGRQER
jgi:SAM-dependent methyltransferase